MPSIYLGSKGNREISQHEFIATTFENESQCVTSLVEDFAAGKVIGTIIGRIEVGPRALCNRSILALPNDASLNATLNRKLNRTEFMPFAPVVRDIDFSEFFEWRGSSKVIDFNSRDFHSPFRFMTMTCEVVKGMRKLIPAVVHVDGTARPQVVTETENPFMYHLLTRMKGQGLLPILVNTSFNAHEEPIILDLQSGLEELRRGSIDVLITDGLKKFTLDK